MRPFFNNRLEALKQGVTGMFLVGGCGLSFISAVLMAVFAMGGVFRGTYTREPLTNKITDAGTINWIPITFVFFTLGVVMMLGAVAFGLYTNATERSGARVTRPAKVLARYGFTRDGHMLVSDWEVEGADNPRYYVRLDFGYPLGTTECECSEMLYFRCGEGMTGMAELQGKWLGSFIPTIGSQYTTEHIADDSHTHSHEGQWDRPGRQG